MLANWAIHRAFWCQQDLKAPRNVCMGGGEELRGHNEQLLHWAAQQQGAGLAVPVGRALQLQRVPDAQACVGSRRWC